MIEKGLMKDYKERLMENKYAAGTRLKKYHNPNSRNEAEKARKQGDGKDKEGRRKARKKKYGEKFFEE